MNGSISIYIQLVFLVFFNVSCHQAQDYLTFDENPPGIIPIEFAKNVIAPNGEHVGYCAFSPDGTELYYAVTTDVWFPSTLLKVTINDLERKDTLNALSDYEGEPFISRDGDTMYRMVIMPPSEGKAYQSDIYRCSKTSDGWGELERLDSTVNSQFSEWHPSLTDDGVMYFVSEKEKRTSVLHGDIYRLGKRKDGGPIKLPYPINTDYNDSDPLIAPDESFLIFHSNRPGGFGEHDLYITFNNKNTWTNPVNMGAEVNTSEWEMAPTLTPDGSYLLFTRRKSINTTEPSKIYWVSTKILDTYR